MTVSFGEIVHAVVDEMACTTSALMPEERTDIFAAERHYTGALIDRLRTLYDEVEAREEREETRRLAAAEREKGMVKAALLEIFESDEGKELLRSVRDGVA